MSLADLPDDAVQRILSFGTHHEITLRWSRVRRQWRDVAYGDAVWRDLMLERLGFAGEDMEPEENWKQYYIRTVLTKEGWQRGMPRSYKMLPMRGHTSYIVKALLRGSYCLSASHDGSTRLWNYLGPAEGCQQVLCMIPRNQHCPPLLCMDSPPDQDGGLSGQVCTGDVNGGVALWDATAGRRLGYWRRSGGAAVASVKVAGSVVSAVQGSEVALWDIRTANAPVLVHDTGGAALQELHGSVPGLLVAAAGWYTIALDVRYASDAHPKASEMRYPQYEEITATAWNQEKGELVVGDASGEVSILRPQDGTVTAVPRKLPTPVSTVAYHGEYLAAGCESGELLVATYFGGGDTSVHKAKVLKVHRARVNHVSLGYSKLLSASADGSVLVTSLGSVPATLFALSGGSLVPSARNPGHPTKPFASEVSFDTKKVLLTWNSMLRLYHFALKPKLAAEAAPPITNV